MSALPPSSNRHDLKDFATYCNRFRDLIPDYQGRAVDLAEEMANSSILPKNLNRESYEIAMRAFNEFVEWVNAHSNPGESDLKEIFLRSTKIRFFNSTALMDEILRALKLEGALSAILEVYP